MKLKTALKGCLILGGLFQAASLAAPAGVNFNSDFGSYQLLHEIVTGQCDGAVSGLGITSAVYTDGEDYLYLYQLSNNSGSALKRVTFAPFADISVATLVGYLETHDVADFKNGGLAPVLAQTGDYDRISPFAGFSFRSFGQGQELLHGQHSAILFVKSDGKPGKIKANALFNDGNATGEVYGAVPEPTTMLLFGAGAVLVCRRQKKCPV